MSFLVFCGDRTCSNNHKGKCMLRKVALNTQGLCMAYSPLPNFDNGMPVVPINLDGDVDEMKPMNKIGFSKD